MSDKLDREQLLQLIRTAVEPLPQVLAMWLDGSDAFDAADQWSDLDIALLVEDGSTLEVFSELEAALEELGPITLRYVLPEPCWHGHRQRFYQLASAAPEHMIDLVVIENGSPASRLNELEIHGRQRLLFDKHGLAAQPHADPLRQRERIANELERLRTRLGLFQHMVDVSLRRGLALDALAFYRSQLLAPLLRLLRIRYCPWRYDWGERYLERDLPAKLASAYRELAFVADLDELVAKKVGRAHAWCRELLDEIDVDALELPLVPDPAPRDRS